MLKRPLDDLLKKRVVVRANGLVYKGILIEVAPHEILLRRETGYLCIPMEHITGIHGHSGSSLKPLPRYVDPSFYVEEDGIQEDFLT